MKTGSRDIKQEEQQKQEEEHEHEHEHTQTITMNSTTRKTLLPCFAPAAGLPLESLTLLLLLVGGRSDGE